MSSRIALSILIAAIASPGLADRIEGQPRTDHVTVFPRGATIGWSIDVAAPAGLHDLVLPGLPQSIDPASLRLSAEGARIGAFALQSERALPGSAPEPEAVIQARARLVEARDALVDFDAEVSALRASAQSWQERAGITRDLMRGDSRVPRDDLEVLVTEAGDLVALYMARSAEETRAADRLLNRRDDALRAVQRAEADLAAIIDEAQQNATLVVTLETNGEPASLTLTGFTPDAGWQPDYDLRLDRQAGNLVLERGLTVQQYSGSDWQDVTLTLSTARPTDRTAPTDVPVWMPRIGPPNPSPSPKSVRQREAIAQGGFLAAGVADETAMVEQAALSSMGITVAYDYPTPVTIRNKADALRLKLDQTRIATEILAEVAPRFDQTAFVIAETTNTTEEPILPGPATLHMDGAMVGRGFLDLTAPGDDLRIGFGPINGITAAHRVPEENEGDRGIIRRSNQTTQTETLIVTNLTDEDWPLRVVDRVPVSVQEDLAVTWSADPRPTQTDPDGRRGILYWQEPLSAGQTREITLTTELRWPEGQQLYR